ncbi:hypothetical protein NM208_g13868 [Fusarium decemcellulare]|uniref:Uncharacterized protein n=1 Tax=Fusarium decemcellulare TaxID=57161 RepID=A0ACC1RME8_9HYPO|nr:hypothetical protein NM208_g13868 [Fusarium decemcellulare]
MGPTLDNSPILRRLDRIFRVKPDPGSDSSQQWSNKDLDPVPPERRTWGPLDIVGYWISDQYATSLWNMGATVVSLGLTLKEGLPIAFAGFFIISIVLTYNGRIGADTHLSFPVIIRASFGVYGAYLAILVRCLFALMWLCILTYQAGGLTAVVLTAIFPSCARIPNTLPEGFGLTSQTMLGFGIFWIIQTPLCLMPVHKLKYFFWFKMVVCPITFFGLFIWGLVVTKGHAPFIDGPTQIQGSKAWAYIQALNILTGLCSTMAINISDFSRFSKKGAVNYWQMFAVPFSGVTPIMCAMVAVAATKQLWGVDAWNPADMITFFDNRAVKFFTSFGFIVGSIGSNVSTNCISFATDITSIWPRYITIFRAALFASILCFAMNPWKIVTNAPSFVAFLGAYPAFLAPVATIMVVDWYLVRKGKVHIIELYDLKGKFYYRYGFNWRAIVAWVVSFAPNLPAFAHAVNPKNPNVQPYTWYISWYFATAVSGIVYYVLCRCWPATSTYVDDPIYEIDGTIDGMGDAEKGGFEEHETQNDGRNSKED